MKSRAKVVVIALIISFIASVIPVYFSDSSSVAVVNAAKEAEFRKAATLLQNDLQEQANKAAARASLIASMRSIEQAFRNKDRADLMRRLEPVFVEQREKYGVREAQFILPPAISFLRVFAPTQGEGEDLSSFRNMVLTTYIKQKPQKGIEIGRRGLSIRVMEVVKDENGPIGVFEVGLDFATILTNFKENTGFDSGVFVDEQMMSTIATLLPQPEADKILGGFRGVEMTDWNIVRPMVNSAILSNAKEIMQLTKTVDGIDYGMVVVPLLDYKGSRIGSIVGIKNFTQYQETLKSMLKQSIIVGFIQMIILMVLILLGISLMSKNQLMKRGM